MFAGQLALIVAALFSGVVVQTVHIAEQPVRFGLGDRALLTEWKPAYKRGFARRRFLLLAINRLFPLGSVGAGKTLTGLWPTRCRDPRSELA